MKLLFLSLVLFFLSMDPLLADMVHFNNGDSARGMVVEDYVDRIVFSTVDGEKTLMKNDIERIEYDDPEMNFMSMGDAAFDKGNYKQAYKYYTVALEINPGLDMIKRKRDHAGLLIFKEKETVKRELVEKMDMLTSRTEPAFENISPEEALKKELGIVFIRTDDGNFKVGGMSMDSPFRKVGFKMGDQIISVWSRLSNYLTMKEFSNVLLAHDEHIIRTTLERKLKLRKESNKALGAAFAIKWEGITVVVVTPGSPAEKAGLKKGDLLVAINDKSIRYVEMRKVLDMLNGESKIRLTIHRSVMVFKPG